MPFLRDLDHDGAVALLASVPKWFVWGVRGGANVDDAAFLLAYPDAHHFRDNQAGLRRCRWCGSLLAGRRQIWCSDDHRETAYQILFWQSLSWVCFLRDGGKCRRCSCALEGADRNRLAGAPWETDHIVPVRNGGTDDPSNLRTLCHDCHVAVGYEQRATEREARNGVSQLGLNIAEVTADP